MEQAASVNQNSDENLLQWIDGAYLYTGLVNNCLEPGQRKAIHQISLKQANIHFADEETDRVKIYKFQRAALYACRVAFGCAKLALKDRLHQRLLPKSKIPSNHISFANANV